MNPSLILAGALGLLVTIGGSYWKGRSDGYKIQEAETARIERVAREAYQSAQKAAAGEIAKIQVNNQTIVQKVQKEIYEKPVYLSADCRHTPDGLHYVNAALTGGAISVGGGKLSRDLGGADK